MGKGDISDLTKRFCVGSNVNANQTYRNVDYKSLTLKLKEEKLKVCLDHQHLKKFNQVKKEYSNTSKQNFHKEIWLKEDISLKSQQKQILSIIKEQASPKQLICDNDICNFLNQIQANFPVFEANTLQPIWEFITDIQNWMFQKNHDNHDEVQELFDSIKSQQGNVLGILESEYQNLDNELETFNRALTSWEFKPETITDDLLHLKFPQEEVLTDFIEQYLVIDQQFDSTLRNLKSYYEVPLSKGKFGGWCKDEHVMFAHVVRQYPVDQHHRSELCLEMLRRIFPQYTEHDLKGHLEWHELIGLYKDHRKTIVRMHQNALQDLVANANTTCKEQWAEHAEKTKRENEISAQKEKSTKLLQQLVKCRKEKASRLDAQKAALAKYNAAVARQLAKMEQRRSKERSADKARLEAYHALKQSQKQKKEAKAQQMQLKEEAAKQESLKAGLKRVEYRQELATQREQKRRDETAAKEHREVKKREKLEKLAATVAITAPHDPLRVLRDTEASCAKIKQPIQEEESHLFRIPGFSDSQIQSDMRFKIEKALRNANLLHTEYGRAVLRGTKPPNPPRRDLVSTAFNTGDQG